jgi:hypothetical protein
MSKEDNMGKIFFFSGIEWIGPGKSRFMVFGPFLSEEQGNKETAYVQARHLKVTEVDAPTWFIELMQMNNGWNDLQLWRWAQELKLAPSMDGW